MCQLSFIIAGRGTHSPYLKTTKKHLFNHIYVTPIFAFFPFHKHNSILRFKTLQRTHIVARAPLKLKKIKKKRYSRPNLIWAKEKFDLGPHSIFFFFFYQLGKLSLVKKKKKKEKRKKKC